MYDNVFSNMNGILLNLISKVMIFKMLIFENILFLYAWATYLKHDLKTLNMVSKLKNDLLYLY